MDARLPLARHARPSVTHLLMLASLIVALLIAPDARGTSAPAAASGGPNLAGRHGALPRERRLLQNDPPAFHPGRILIKPKARVDRAALTAIGARRQGRVARQFSGLANLEVVEFPTGSDIAALVQDYRRSGLVEYAEPDYVVQLDVVPNDPDIGTQLWGLNNTGQTGGTPDADIDAPEGWDVRSAAPTVVVTVIDTGVRYTHQDLAANIWTNPDEIAGNGLDDDNNGYVDDLHGINAILNTGDPADDNGHGTHVAGTIGAVGNNGVGITGVAWQVKIMPCKFLGANGQGYTSDAIKCVDYARREGAHILSNSWGGGDYSAALYDAIVAARNAGIIFVAAAGNEGKDNQVTPTYPADYNVDNIITVAATDHADVLAGFSNYGQGAVDLAAPGVNIYSTWHTADSAYNTISGTSMATPHVSGALALLRAQFPGDSAMRLFTRLLDATDPVAGLVGKTRAGRLNLSRALRSTSTVPRNDSFAGAVAAGSRSFSVSGISVDATKETGEPAHAGNAGGRSIWWAWTPAASGVVTMTTSGSTFNTLLGVYTGSSVAGLTLVASNDDSAGSQSSSVTFNADVGVTYRIAVDGFGGASGAVTLKATFDARPDNDNFAQRAAITASGVVAGGNRLATKEAGEPAHAGNAGGASVWWSWTAPESRSATISTAGSTFNTLLGVYTGSSVASLTLVAANDDSAGGVTTSSVTFNAVAGTTYQIAVDGFGGATGRITLHLPPANDSFARRAALAGVSVSALADTAQATKEAGEPAHAGNAGGRSVWWSWTASQSGRFTLATTASTFDTLLAVYTGSAVSGLTPVAANDNDPYGGLGSRLSFDAVAGTSYQIAVDGAGGTGGLAVLDGGYGHLVSALGDLGGIYNQCWADGLNDANQVVGNCYDYASSAQVPFSWRAGVGLQQLPLGGRVAGNAYGINNLGQIVGWAAFQSSPSVPVLWQNGVVSQLPLLPGGVFGVAFDINNTGEVVGYSGTASGVEHATLWRNGTVVDLGTLGGPRSRAFGINNLGQVVGQSERANGTYGAFLWQNGTMQDIGFLPGGDDGAAALEINDNGAIVGESFASDGSRPSKAFLWQNGSMVELPQFPELAGGTTVAHSINDAGLVSGQMGGSVAVQWEVGVPTRLTSLISAPGWELFSGQDLNTYGQVAGGGLFGRGTAFLLSPPVSATQPTRTPTRTATGATATNTSTATRTATRTSTATSTATATGATATRTSTATSTATTTGATATRTSTATSTATRTATSSVPGGLKVQYRAGDTAASTNQFKPLLNVVNTGSAGVPLAELKARYYYVKEGTVSEEYHCDHAVLGCGSITGSLVALGGSYSGATHYLELGFTSAAGTLAAGGQTGEVQSRVNKTDWTSYTQTGDYSFDPTKTAFADWSKVTLYRASTLVWGTPPAPLGTATSTATATGVTATRTSSATSTATRTSTATTTGATATRTSTATTTGATATRTSSATSTATATGVTATRTSSATSTATRTSTATTGATATRTSSATSTATTTGATATRTSSATSTATRTATSSVPGGLKVQYRAGDTAASTNQFKPLLNVVNTGSAGVPLAELKARYYYVKEGTASEEYHCDYAVLNCGSVTGSLVALGGSYSGATHYLELGFTSAAGTLAAGGQTGEVQSRVNKIDWTSYTQTGDYSFDPTKTAFADWGKVTLYRAGTLVWGTPPALSGAAARMAPTGDGSASWYAAAARGGASIRP